jgi:hypothetical protein
MSGGGMLDTATLAAVGKWVRLRFVVANMIGSKRQALRHTTIWCVAAAFFAYMGTRQDHEE